MLSFVPGTLQFFTSSLCPPQLKPKDVKIAAIGQVLIKLPRPNTTLCPLLLAFAAEMHHKSGGSETVVQLLHSIGFGSSIEKVRELEKSLCFHDSSSSIVDFNELLGLLLYSADNADILQAILDGKNTLHMMGIICSVVKQGSMQHKPILKKCLTKEDLLKFAIPINYTSKINKSEIPVVLKPTNSFNIITGSENMAFICDLFKLPASLRRSVYEWSGFMHQITINVDADGIHQVEFLPFVDLDPNIMSTVFTTLMLVSDQCKKHKVEPVVTFDQLLWLKAMMIKKKNSLPITILLENFHTQMSFLGFIGHVMKNSGILELLSTAYAPNSAK